MNGVTPRRFSTEFKIRLVKEYLETDISYLKMAAKYNIDYAVIRNWVCKYKVHKEAAFERKPGRRRSFIDNENNIPAVLKEEIGLDKLNNKESEDERIQRRFEELKMDLAEKELKIKLLEEKIRAIENEDKAKKKK